MRDSTENRASGSFEKSSGESVTFTWTTAHRMLPLVGRVVADILEHEKQLAQLQAEKVRLDRKRHSLAWPERSRRYVLQEEVQSADKHLRDVRAELEVLGVALIDAREGLVGFPTMVNDRPAFFSWRPGETELLYWNFADETERQPIPAHWTKPPEPRRRGSRPRS
jgi:hypothetical protein